MRKSLVVMFAVVLSLGTVAAFADSTPDGAALYKAKCAMCHGPDGKAQTTMGRNLKLKDLGSADVQKLSDTELYNIIANGKGKMVAFKGKLTDAEIKSLVVHIRDLAPKKEKK